MLRGLFKLTWLETKIFLREPLGVIGTVGFPIVLFLLMRRMGRGAPRNSLPPLLAGDLPVLAAVDGVAERRRVARRDHRDLP